MDSINYDFGGISMRQKIAVLGPGSWGTALAQTLAENGHDVRIWGNVPEQIDEINTYHTNQHFLPDLKIPETIIGYHELAEAVDGADAVLFVVPTKAIRAVAQELISKMNTKPVIIHASKGLEQGLSLIHISEPTRRTPISYAVFCLKKKKKTNKKKNKKMKKKKKII